MGSPLAAIGRVLFWRYQRGGWQYDILCLVIILFIFLTPRSVFDGSVFDQQSEAQNEDSLTANSDASPPEFLQEKTPEPEDETTQTTN